MNKKLLSNKKLIIGAFLSIIFLIIALVSLIYTPYDPAAMNASDKFAGISFKHIMGCDNFGRDIFSRVMAGTKITIFIAIGTNIIGLFFGIIIGALTGYYGGILDEILMRFNDAVLAFPTCACIFECFWAGTDKCDDFTWYCICPKLCKNNKE